MQTLRSIFALENLNKKFNPFNSQDLIVNSPL